MVSEEMVKVACTAYAEGLGMHLTMESKMRRALEAALRAKVGLEAHPLARFGSPTAAPLGLYRIHWKSGGSSLAAIGMMENGDRWIAPTNWLRPGMMPSAGEWGEIERLEPIPSHTRREALEEVARMAEEFSFAKDVDWWLKATKKEVSEATGLQIAAAIRDLISTPAVAQRVEPEDSDQKTGRAAQALPQGTPCGCVSSRDQVAVASVEDDYFGRLVAKSREAAAKASVKFPQPNYVVLKIGEEAGELLRSAIHYAEGRMDWSEVEGEIVQLLAMLIRFVTEGDHVNGIIPPCAARSEGGAQNG